MAGGKGTGACGGDRRVSSGHLSRPLSIAQWTRDPASAHTYNCNSSTSAPISAHYCNSSSMGGKVIEVGTQQEWDQQLADAKAAGKTVIVDFSATWCGPCNMIAPFYAQLSEQYGDKLVFLKVDVDANQAVAAACGISAMPTFMAFKDGAKVDEMLGAAKDKLKAFVEKHAAA